MANIDPKVLTASDIGQLHQLFKYNPCSDQLDELFQRWHYPVEVLKMMRCEDFRSADAHTIGSFIKRFTKKYYNAIARNTVWKPFSDMLKNSQVTLAMKCYIICSPMLIRAFERVTGLEETGDYDKCVENYRKRHYTNQMVFANVIDKIIMSTDNGAINNVLDDIRQLSPDLDFMKKSKILYVLLKSDHEEAIDIFLNKFDFNLLFIFNNAISSGNLRILKRVIDKARENEQILNFDGETESAAISGNLEMIQFILPLDTNVNKYERCFIQIVQRHDVNLLKRVKELYTQEYTDFVQSHPNMQVRNFEMTKFLLRDGFIHYNIFNNITNHVNEKDFMSFIIEYSHLLAIKHFSAVACAAIRSYNYVIFDFILPFLIKHNYCDVDSLEQSIRVDSRYFFDKLYFQFNYTINYLRHCMKTLVKTVNQKYFFQIITQQHPEIFDNGEIFRFDIIISSISHRHYDAFYYAMRNNVYDEGKLIACRKSYMCGNYECFKYLFQPIFYNEKDIKFILDCSERDGTFYVSSRPSKISTKIFDRMFKTGEKFIRVLVVKTLLQYLKKCQNGDIEFINDCLPILEKSKLCVSLDLVIISFLSDPDLELTVLKVILEHPLAKTDTLKECILYLLSNCKDENKASLANQISTMLEFNVKCVKELLPRITSLSFERDLQTNDILSITRLEIE